MVERSLSPQMSGKLVSVRAVFAGPGTPWQGLVGMQGGRVLAVQPWEKYFIVLSLIFLFVCSDCLSATP